MDVRQCVYRVATVILCVPLLSVAYADEASKDIAAIEFLGTVDCYWYPEAQTVLLQSLLADPREPVRYAAAQALRQQLQRGKPPLNPLLGWRDVPDPLILTQICRLATLEHPLTYAEMMESYSQRKFEAEQERGAGRGDTDRGNCNPKVVAALSKVAYGVDEVGCCYEPSERIRKHAETTLQLCIDKTVETLPMREVPPQPVPPSTETQPTPPETQQTPETLPEETFSYTPRSSFYESRFQEFVRTPPIAGRADTANRFNFFDNMSPEPRTRAYFAYQYIATQNNAVFVGGQNNDLFSILDTINGRSRFIEFTGFGSGVGTAGGGGDVVVDPVNPASKQQLIDLYLEHNAGRTSKFLLSPNTNLYRYGLEYALTLDFSFALQAQYVQPIDDVEQPDMFSNPLIQLKHVVFRDERTTLSGVLGIQPQIPSPSFAIVEDTTRLMPGILLYHALDDAQKWFIQGGTGFSFPMDNENIKTWDYVAGLGFWLYRHESLLPGSRAEEPSHWLIGAVPEIDVVGKHIMGRDTVEGIFNLSADAPQMAEGTTRQLADGTYTTDIYLPQNPTQRVGDVALLFEEPRHVVDLTLALTLMFRHNINVTTGLSIPVTGNNARATEFIAAINYLF